MKKLINMILLFIIIFSISALIGYENYGTMIEYVDGETPQEVIEAREKILKDREMIAKLKDSIKPMESIIKSDTVLKAEIRAENIEDTAEETYKVSRVAKDKLVDGSENAERVKLENITNLEQLKVEIIKDIDSVVSDLKISGYTKYIKEVEFKDDYKVINIKVDKAEYKESSNESVVNLLLAITLTTYHEIFGKGLGLDINYMDIETGDILKTYEY